MMPLFVAAKMVKGKVAYMATRPKTRRTDELSDLATANSWPLHGVARQESFSPHG